MSCQVYFLFILFYFIFILITIKIQFFSISVSPKGWTDQELGSLWLETDFEPATAIRNKMNGYRLLILDGHNSHTTFRFCSFAANHRILILCLPSHTTHVLQPNDVGVFGPLGSAWKTVIVNANREGISMRKDNILYYYSVARSRVFTPTTMSSAFLKTGIWPFNPSIIPESAFEPSLNTTTQSAQPIPTSIPAILTPIPSSAPQSSHAPLDPTPSSSYTMLPPSTTALTVPLPEASTSQIPRFEITGLPAPLPHTASRNDLRAENARLRDIINTAKAALEKDVAQMHLMDIENGRLQIQLFNKAKKPSKKLSSHSRHLTAEENLDLLARAQWEQSMKAVLKEAMPILQTCKQKIQNHADAAKRSQAQLAAQEKAQEKAQERARKKAEQMAEQAEKAEERLRKREAEKARKEAEKVARAAERAAEKKRKETEKAAQKKAKIPKPTQQRRCRSVSMEPEEEMSEVVTAARTPRARRRTKV